VKKKTTITGPYHQAFKENVSLESQTLEVKLAVTMALLNLGKTITFGSS
jgi:hypothetical protein